MDRTKTALSAAFALLVGIAGWVPTAFSDAALPAESSGPSGGTAPSEAPKATGVAKINLAAYVGSERCKECHASQYAGWVQTFHATVVQDARKHPDAVLGDFAAPGLSFKLTDVDFTIGGHWDQRYMQKIGDDYYVLPKLWSVQARAWRPYNVWSWKKMPYSKYCKGCHVSGYDPETKTVVESRIGCEACHGPGRPHAEAGGEKAIVNPKKLSEARRDMICAACHVRGQDLTGTYFFPVGFVPGDDLGTVYAPLEKNNDESNTDAILRGFSKWKEDRSANAKVRCEVCGIYGGDENKKSDEKKGVMDFCFGCHAFKDKLPEHTHHAASVTIVCVDCHAQQTKDLMNQQGQDIHSYGYFLVHPDNCYDPRVENTCGKCHKDKPQNWARKTVEHWRKPVDVDH